MASSFIFAFPLATLGVYTKSGCFPLGRLVFWILLQTSLTSNTLAVSALPQCYEGDPWTGQLIACTSVTISELDDGYLISRGMDGYSADESVSIELDSGPGTLSFTDFNTEEWSDFVYIDIYAVDHTFVEWFSFAGASKPPDIDIFGYARIFWNTLSSKGAGFGWVFTFTSNPNITSTTATSMTTTIMAASALPQCIEYDTSTWEAITCTSVTISELDEGYYLISRGMDGYSAGESVSIELDSGPGTLSFTDFNTEEWSDFVYIDIYAVDHTFVEWFSFAGASKPPDIDIFGYARIFWNTLSSKGAGFGWVFTFTSNPNITSTTATSMTTTIMAASALPQCIEYDTSTWEAITCTSVTISELDEGYYLISRGMDGYSADESVSIELDSGPGTLSFTDFNTEEWSDSVYIDIYALDHTFVEWFSFAGASKPPDIDIFGYARIFWNTLSSKGAGFGWVFTFTSNPNITSTTATSMTTTIMAASALPQCIEYDTSTWEAITCTSVTISELDEGYYLISRGMDGYSAGESVSIELDSGPGTLSFTDFNTEEWSDFVYIDIYAVDHTFVEWFSFAGASKPPDIDIFGYARIFWNTLSSKGAGFGWVFTFTSNPNITSTTATSMTTTIMAASALPQCIEYDTSTWEAITCTSVTISELDEGYYLISRGMDGYSAGESVSIELDSGPGTLSFTDFNTEEWSDFVYIDIYAVDHTFVEWFSFAGASKPPDIDIFGYARIFWNTLSSKGAGFGWVFTFTSNPNITSTTATSMTTTIMAASALPQCIEYDTSTWEAITCTSVTISELDEGYYLISRGMDGYSAGESVSIELDSGPGTLSFTDFNTEEWSDFVYIDIYAVDHTFVEWFSFAGASKPPDIDIFGYARIFWNTLSSKGAGFGWVFTFTSNPNITSTTATSMTTTIMAASALPQCIEYDTSTWEAITCTSVTISELDEGYYLISRGMDGYSAGESVSIELDSGPGTLSFTDFNTEEWSDFVYIDIYAVDHTFVEWFSFAGASKPPDIDIFGYARIFWNTLSSKGAGFGWVFTFTSNPNITSTTATSMTTTIMAASALPQCIEYDTSTWEAITCTSVTISELDEGYYLISRGMDGYSAGESVSIELDSGPGTLSFTDFNTEEWSDFVYIDIYAVDHTFVEWFPFAGASKPPDIDIFGYAGIFWNTLSSKGAGFGWVFTFTSNPNITSTTATSMTTTIMAASALPQCIEYDTSTWEAITCTSVTISELDEGYYLISRGMDGYSAGESVSIELDSGPGTLSFTDFNTEEWSDFVYIDIYAVDHTFVEWFSFAGASKPPDIDIFGYARIFWNTLSSKGAGFGWVFTFTSNPNITSTTATSMTTTIMAASALPQCIEYDTSTWEAITCTSVTISELDDGYLISRGMDGYSADESVSIELDSGPGTLSFTDFNTEEWSDFVYIDIYAVDHTFVEWFSFAGASKPPDIDIFGYARIFWNTLSSKGAGFGWVFTFTSNPNITSTTATSMTTTIMAASALPQCIEYDTSTWEAITCTSVTISELDEGYYLISRGMDGYSAGESVSIELDSGPGTLSFTDFNTEEWSDFVYIDIYAVDHTFVEWFSFAGASKPPDIDIFGYARIFWNTLSSKGAGFGWVFTFTSNPNITSTTATSMTTTIMAASALPQCIEYDTSTWEAITCTSVTISELDDGYLISRGMDGYSADESVSIELDSGPGTLSFTDFNTEEWSDSRSTSIFMPLIILLSSGSRSLVHLNLLTLISLATPESCGIHCHQKGPDLAGSSHSPAIQTSLPPPRPA